MKTALYKEILQEYEYQRDLNRRDLEERQRMVLEKIPELKNIENQITNLMFGQAKKVLLDPQHAEEIIHDIDQKLESLNVQKRVLLHDHGFPMDYLEPAYTCPKCKDTGFTGEIVKERCSCLTQRLLQRAYQLSNIQELSAQNFNTFSLSVFPDTCPEGSKISQRSYMEKVKNRCKHYADTFPVTDKLNMVFTGQTGLGKTFLLNCIAKDILDRGFTVLKITAYKLFHVLFQYHTENKKEGGTEIDHLFQVDLLIIDDLGAEPLMNNVTVEYLFTVLNERIQQRRHTLVSTNLSPKEILLRYSERISSRLLDTSTASIIRFIGADVRLNNR